MACWIGAILIGCTFISAVLMIPLDAKLDHLVAKKEEEKEEEKSLLLHSPDLDATTNATTTSDIVNNGRAPDDLHMSDVFKLSYVFRIITVTVILVYGE